MLWQYPLWTVKQNIKQHGGKYTFQRYKKDERGQETEELEEVCTVPALYHISKGYVTKSTGDYGVTRSKGQPMLLCITENSEGIELLDVVTVGKDMYRVTEVNDLNNEGIIADISLELVDDGR